MQLFRTICSTDHKYRPTHKLTLIGTANSKEELKAKMDMDVRRWQAEDVASDEVLKMEEGDEDVPDSYEDRRVVELVQDPHLPEFWQTDVRWEMRLVDCDHREFVEVCDGNCTTISYHFLD